MACHLLRSKVTPKKYQILRRSIWSWQQLRHYQRWLSLMWIVMHLTHSPLIWQNLANQNKYKSFLWMLVTLKPVRLYYISDRCLYGDQILLVLVVLWVYFSHTSSETVKIAKYHMWRIQHNFNLTAENKNLLHNVTFFIVFDPLFKTWKCTCI